MSELKKSTQMLPSPGSHFGPPTKTEGAKRISTKRGRDNRLFTLTQDIIGTYKRCNPAFKAIEVLPQRILTVPSEGAHNGGRDNEDSNLICRVNDTFAMDGYTFTILDLLGTGTFGQVFRCIRSDTKDIVAVKVVKNKPAYHAQGLLEIKVARLLNQTHDPNDERHIVRLLDSFEYHGHVCLVFELLSVSLLDVLTQNQFRGLPLVVVQRFTRQILTALVAMEEADVIHCDLKPENILLVPSHSNPSSPARRAHQTPAAPAEGETASSNKDSSSSGGGSAEPAALGGAGVEGEAGGMEAKTSPGNPARRSSGGGGVSDVKVIDFGSACFEGQTMYSYIQSRFCKCFVLSPIESPLTCVTYPPFAPTRQTGPPKCF
jgi:serine/threonine protein kinase